MEINLTVNATKKSLIEESKRKINHHIEFLKALEIFVGRMYEWYHIESESKTVRYYMVGDKFFIQGFDSNMNWFDKEITLEEFGKMKPDIWYASTHMANIFKNYAVKLGFGKSNCSVDSMTSGVNLTCGDVVIFKDGILVYEDEVFERGQMFRLKEDGSKCMLVSLGFGKYVMLNVDRGQQIRLASPIIVDDFEKLTRSFLIERVPSFFDMFEVVEEVKVSPETFSIGDRFCFKGSHKYILVSMETKEVQLINLETGARYMSNNLKVESIRKISKKDFQDWAGSDLVYIGR